MSNDNKIMSTKDYNDLSKKKRIKLPGHKPQEEV